MSSEKSSVRSSGPVESLYDDYVGLVHDLSTSSPSGLTALNRSYNKVILIAAASNLEDQVKREVESVFSNHGRSELGWFVNKRVMSRSYHTLFDWEAQTATGFFSSFGSACKAEFKSLLNNDEGFSASHSGFMRLGNLRNQLVHQDYASFPLELTPEDLIDMYRHAVFFAPRFEELIIATPAQSAAGSEVST